MSDSEITSMRVTKTTLKRLRKHKPKKLGVSYSDEWALTYVLDKVEEKEASA